MYGKAKLQSSEMIVTLYKKTIPIILLFNEHTFPPGPGTNHSKKMLDNLTKLPLFCGRTVFSNFKCLKFILMVVLFQFGCLVRKLNFLNKS